MSLFHIKDANFVRELLKFPRLNSAKMITGNQGFVFTDAPDLKRHYLNLKDKVCKEDNKRSTRLCLL